MTTIQTATASFQLKEIKVGDYRFQFGTNDKGKPTFYYGKVLTAGKNKGTLKYIKRYFYRSVEQRDQSARETIESYTKQIQSKAEYKATKLAAAKSIDRTSLVGKIFYASWGYEQTNIDFFQVVSVKAKQVTIREIAAESILDSEGFMCDRCKPCPNEFIGEPLTKLIKANPDGSLYITISSYKHASEYTTGEQGVYRSWYA